MSLSLPPWGPVGEHGGGLFTGNFDSERGL